MVDLEWESLLGNRKGIRWLGVEELDVEVHSERYYCSKWRRKGEEEVVENQKLPKRVLR